MTFREWLNNQVEKRAERIDAGKATFANRGLLFEGLVLNDGTELSVQASEAHLCEPRDTIKEPDVYRSVEVYTHGEIVKELSELSDTEEFIYGYISLDFMEYLVEQHGGIKE